MLAFSENAPWTAFALNRLSINSSAKTVLLQTMPGDALQQVSRHGLRDGAGHILPLPVGCGMLRGNAGCSYVGSTVVLHAVETQTPDLPESRIGGGRIRAPANLAQITSKLYVDQERGQIRHSGRNAKPPKFGGSAPKHRAPLFLRSGQLLRPRRASQELLCK